MHHPSAPVLLFFSLTCASPSQGAEGSEDWPSQASECSPRENKLGGCRASAVVSTRNGPVQGVAHRSPDTSWASVSTFLGIPFAEPPTGENRLRAPQPLKATWSKPLEATRRSKVCIQVPPVAAQLNATTDGAASDQSEDCLYLNVYAPTAAVGSKSPLPVMVWIYGGAFIMGDAYQVVLGTSLYDGSALAGRHDVVVVTLNYRLGALGFFASDALRAEDPQGSTGNQAVRDQRMALQWVQDNIAGFGGDPRRVTLFGESAGAFSVMWHLVSRPSWPLFSRAILESGTSRLSWFFQPFQNKSREFYAQWSEKIGCPRGGPGQLECLRRVDPLKLVLPPAGITAASPLYDATATAVSLYAGPAVDGSEVGLEGTPLELLRQGRFNQVPLIVGACRDGGTMFEPLILDIVPGLSPPEAHSRGEVETALDFAFGRPQSLEIKAAYPDSEFQSGPAGVDYAKMLSRIIRDAAFQCSDREVAEAWAARGLPVWMFTFSLDLGFLDKRSGLGDLHGSEVLFVFRRFLWLPEILALHGSFAMADIISCKWTTFAHTASPNGAGSASWPPHCSDVHPKYQAWPQYVHGGRQYYSLMYPPQVAALRPNNTWPDDEFPSDRRCDMWNRQGYPWHGVSGGVAPAPSLLV